MRSSERTECIKSLIKLKQQQEVIERGLDNFLDSAKLGPDVLRDLRNEERSLASDRKQLASSVRMSAEEIVNDMRAIRSVVGALQEGRNIDIDSFRAKLVAVAEKIREFKKDLTLEKLSNDQIVLDRDVRDFFLTMYKYGIRNCAGSTRIAWSESSRNKNSGSTDRDNYNGSRDFDALVAKTGHTQNWSEEDHSFFLKIRKTARGVPAMVAAIRKKFPDMSSERIVNHEAWYKVYLELREKHRKTIRDWREKQEARKRSKLGSAENEIGRPNSDEKMSSFDEVAIETKPAVSRSVARSAAKKDPCACDKRESLHRWRAKKEKARSVEAEKTKLEIESREALKESRRLSRAREIKSAIEAYREKKIENMSSSATASVAESDRLAAKSHAAKLIESFRRRDEELLSKKRALLASKKSHSSSSIRPRVDARSEKGSTLLKPTKVWMEKCRAEEPLAEPRQKIFYVKDIPKLATRDWRDRESM